MMEIEWIKAEFRKSKNIGLLYGKTGASIASFLLQDSHIGLDKRYGEELLTEVFDQISENMPLNISQGLAGIGLGINYLIKRHYVEGNPDHVLKEIDEILFKRIVYYGEKDNIDCMGLSEILFYFLIRLKTGLKNKMERAIFVEFAKKALNMIYMGKKLDFFEEPLPYSIYYPLPCFLYLCSFMYDMNIYTNRINHILEEIKAIVFSRVPFLNCNRLTMMASVLHVAKSTKDSDWYDYLSLLHNAFSFDKMLEEEIGNKQIFLTDGLLGISLIANDYNKNCSQEKYSITVPDIRPLVSQSLRLREFEQPNEEARLGLDGLLGIMLYNKK